MQQLWEHDREGLGMQSHGVSSSPTEPIKLQLTETLAAFVVMISVTLVDKVPITAMSVSMMGKTKLTMGTGGTKLSTRRINREMAGTKIMTTSRNGSPTTSTTEVSPSARIGTSNIPLAADAAGVGVLSIWAFT